MGSRNTPVDEIAGEEWRPVRDAPYYHVSNMGRVRRLGGSGRGVVSDRLLLPQIGTTGYPSLLLAYPDKPRYRKIHQIVADAFIAPRGPGQMVNHIDGDKTNNTSQNLEITDHAGNVAHAVAHGLVRSGIRHGMAKLTDAQVRQIRADFAAGVDGLTIAAQYGISRSYAYHIKQNRERASA